MTDPVEQNGLPSDPEVERMILGNVIHRGVDFRQLAALLTTRDFSVEAHRRIWLVAETLDQAGDTIDTVTVYRELEKRKQAQTVGGLTYLADLDCPRLVNVEAYCRRLKEHSIRRRAISLCETMQNQASLGQGTSAEVLETMRAGLEALEREETQQARLLNFEEIFEREGGLDNIASRRHVGIPFPWRTLNWLTAGMHPGQLIVLAARPGVGKSAAALQIGLHAAAKGFHGALFSLEMGRRELAIRALCGAAQIDSTALKGGQLVQEERLKLARAANEIARLPLKIDDSTAVTIPAMRAALIRHRQKHRLDFAILDYLGLCDTVGRVENRVQAVSQISRSLKLLAREFEIPVMVLSQLSRVSVQEKREPELSDLRDSGSIEQDADVVMFLHAADDPARDSSAPIATKLLIKKQRSGQRGRIELMFSPRFCQFHEQESEASV